MYAVDMPPQRQKKPRTATKSEAVEFNGITFRRYPDAKQWSHRMYYTPHAGWRLLGIGALHQELWKSINGPIPDGYEIHHSDDDSLNNVIGNLECITVAEHKRRHAAAASQRNKTPEGRKRFEATQRAAAKWHGSPAGLAWHREHAREQGFGIREPADVVCAHCGINYKTSAPARAKFCSTKCRQRSYAADGRLLVRKLCVICCKEFTTTKHGRSAVSCGRKCGRQVAKRRAAGVQLDG